MGAGALMAFSMEPSDFKTQVLAQSPAAASGAAPDMAGVLDARYEMLDNLGEGGMGLVYRVRDRETNEILALKLLRPEIARDPARKSPRRKSSCTGCVASNNAGTNDNVCRSVRRAHPTLRSEFRTQYTRSYLKNTFYKNFGTQVI